MKIFLQTTSIAVAFGIVIFGQSVSAESTPLEKSCGRFVQSFYDWYSKPDVKTHKEHTPERAIIEKSTLFDEQLKRELKIDSDAQAKGEGDIVGLDFDPFLSTNSEPFEHYSLGKIIAKPQSYLVEVFGTTKGKKTAKPVVVAELKNKGNQWKFVNFHYEKSKYPENENLLSVLKTLRESRKAH